MKLMLMLVLAVCVCMGEDDLPVVNRLLEGKVFTFEEDVVVGEMRVAVKGNVSNVYLPGEGLSVVREGDALTVTVMANLDTYMMYHVKEGKYLGEKGTANASLELQYHATLDTATRTHLTYTSCTAALKIPHLQLTGIASLFRLEVLEYIKIEGPLMLCEDSGIPQMLSRGIGSTIAALDGYSAMELPDVAQENEAQEEAHGLQGITGAVKYNASHILAAVNTILGSVFDAPTNTSQSALGTVFDVQDIWAPYFPDQPAGFPSIVNLTLDTNIAEGNTTVSLLYAVLEGLDSIKDVHLAPITDYSLLVSVNFTQVNITLAANVSAGGYSDIVLLRATQLTNFGLEASVLAPVSADRAGGMTLGNLTKGNLACVLYPLLDFNITYLTISSSGLQAITEQGLLQGELQGSINTLLGSMLGTFTPDVFTALPSLMQYKVLPVVNQKVGSFLAPYLNATRDPCKAHAELSDSYVSLNTSTLLRVLQWAVDDFIGTTDQINVNNITHALTETGSFRLPYTVGGKVIEFGGNVSNITLGGLDTFTLLGLLHATSDYDMTNELQFSPRLTFNLAVSFTSTEQQPFSAQLLVDMYLPDLFINITTMTKIVTALLNQVPVSKVLSPSCLLSTISRDEGLAIPSFNGSVDEMLVTITTLEQQGMPMLDQFEEDLQKPEAIAQMTRSVNMFLGKYMNVILNRNATIQQLNNVVGNSSCDEQPHTPGPTAAGSDTLTETDCYIIVFGTVAAVAVILLAIYFCRRHNHEDEENLALVGLNNESPQVTPSLLTHPAVPVYVRYGMPFLLVCTICVFFTGNVVLGARVRATAYLAGSQVEIKDVFSYDLTSTISDMWNGNAYLLSVLIAAFSGIWPYVKLLFLLFTWCSPSSVISTSTRGYILRVIDILGKWSLIDDFMIVFLMVAFRLHFKTPASWTFMPEGLLGLDLYVEPHFGMYAFLSAAISTLVLNHVQIAYHRSAVERDQGFEKSWFDVGAEDTTKRVLCLFTDDCDSNTQCRKAKRTSLMRRVVAWGVTFLLMFTLALLVWGCTVDAFRFEFQGLAAYALEITNPGAQTTEHSVFSLTALMSQASTPGEYVGYGYLMVSFITFSFFTPVLSMLLLIVLWTAPLKLQHQKYLFFVNEMVAAWSAIEVFILALTAAVFELPQFAQFMIGHKCDLINEITGVFAGPLDLDSDKCFDVKTTLLGGCWILFSAAVISNFTFQVTWYAAEHMINKVEHHAGAADKKPNINEDAC